jgi:putative thioredoxin
MSEASQWVFNCETIPQFEAEVIEKSHEVPVIVDMWSPQCQPCLMLAPILERLVNAQDGQILLAKINTLQAQDLAMALQVSSIPDVYVFVNGQAVDRFIGLKPEPELQEWIARFVPSKAEKLISEALQIEETDQVTAEAKFRESLEIEETDSTKLHLARVLLAQSRDADCKAIVDQLEARGFLEPEGETLKAQLEMRANAEESGGVKAARDACEAAPDDAALRITLAEAIAVDGNHQEALEILLAIVSDDKTSEQGENAKQQMVKLFDVLGGGNALVLEYRKKLATLLY